MFIKRLCLFFVVCLCCLLCSCGDKEEKVTVGRTEYTKAEEIDNPDPFLSIKTEKDRYSVNDTKISYILSVSPGANSEHANCGESCSCPSLSAGGSYWDLQVLKEDGWYSLPWRPAPPGEVLWIPFNNMLVKPGQTYVETVDLEHYYTFPLPPGEYRLLRSERICSNTFIIE